VSGLHYSKDYERLIFLLVLISEMQVRKVHIVSSMVLHTTRGYADMTPSDDIFCAASSPLAVSMAILFFTCVLKSCAFD
jgi:hypothetical protein